MTERLEEHDEAWSARFTAEADQIRAALGAQLRRVEHVGSTAVPGLVARPVIDVALSLEDLAELDVAALEALGYAPAGDGELRRPGFHLRVHEQEDDDFLDHLRVRDYLRTHPEDRDAFAALKRAAGDDDVAKARYLERLVGALRRT